MYGSAPIRFAAALAIFIQGICFYFRQTSAAELRPVSDRFEDLFCFEDTCNVYVLKSGERALLIDFGSGDVVEHLNEIGVKQIDWVLFTHHHREQCQGIGRLNGEDSRIAAPSAERELFEKPLAFRRWHPSLDDRFSVYGASYVRPPASTVKLDQVFSDGERFSWAGHSIECLALPGDSPGSMAYVIEMNGQKLAFSGDLMHDGAKMVTWFDSEWDYGFAKGLDTLISSVARAAEQKFDRLLPSHGPIVKDPSQLLQYKEKLQTFRTSYLRGYPVFELSNEERDSLSKPTAVPHLNQVSPHLFKLRDATKGQNFAMIIADSGHALVIDCGLLPAVMLEEIVVGARTHLGLKQIDAFWISHMHGDHFLLGPYMREKYGASSWTLDRIVDRCEHPRRYDYAALVSAYGDGFDGMKIDRSIKDGEIIEWEGFQIHVDWMPGQTEFGCCLWLEIDGKRVAFTGDNLFGNPADSRQNGHEAVVARNSCVFEEGYLYGSQYLLKLQPDIIMGSHSFVMNRPQEFIQRYHAWAQHMSRLYRELLPDPNYEYRFDPYWVSAYPYRVELVEDKAVQVQVTIRNFRDKVQQHRVQLVTPTGIKAEPAWLVGEVPARGRATFPVVLTASSQTAKGLAIIPLDIELDGRRYGQWFDFLVNVNKAED